MQFYYVQFKNKHDIQTKIHASKQITVNESYIILTAHVFYININVTLSSNFKGWRIYHVLLCNMKKYGNKVWYFAGKYNSCHSSAGGDSSLNWLLGILPVSDCSNVEGKGTATGDTVAAALGKPPGFGATMNTLYT